LTAANIIREGFKFLSIKIRVQFCKWETQTKFFFWLSFHNSKSFANSYGIRLAHISETCANSQLLALWNFRIFKGSIGNVAGWEYIKLNVLRFGIDIAAYSVCFSVMRWQRRQQSLALSIQNMTSKWGWLENK
jgi:hypothetical protein